MPDVRIFPDRERLSRAVAEALVSSARERAATAGRFSVALAGGSTPRRLYDLLATEYRDEMPWNHVHLFWSDERCVPHEHADSNVGMLREALLEKVDVPVGNIHPPPTDFDDPEDAALVYEATIRDFWATEEPRLDWVLLGLGEDGHFASLFPGSSALEEKTRSILVVRDSPKPPPVRLTMTLPVINQTAQINFLVSGGGKAHALRSTLETPTDPSRWPAQRIQPIRGTLTWWLDDEAAGGL